MSHYRIFRLGLAGLLVIISCATVYAQESQEPAQDQDQDNNQEQVIPDYFDHDLGDQQFNIRLGGYAPLFFAGSQDGIQQTNMKLGGAGALRWSAYINNWYSTGVELNGSLASNVNGEQLYQFNISSANTFYPLRAYPFLFPLTLDVGAQFMRFQDSSYFGPVIKPGIAALYTTDSGWSFGTHLLYWIVPEIYTGSGGPPESDSRIGNFLEIGLNAMYHF